MHYNPPSPIALSLAVSCSYFAANLDFALNFSPKKNST
jgi:hypothetical protein